MEGHFKIRPNTPVCISHVHLCVHSLHNTKYMNVRQGGARGERRKLPKDTLHNCTKSDSYQGVKREGVDFFGEEKDPLPLPGIEPKLYSWPAHSLPSTMSQYQLYQDGL